MYHLVKPKKAAKIFFNLSVDNNIQKIIRDLNCPTCTNKKCVSCEQKKICSFYYCKQFAASCHVPKTSFGKHKPALTLFHEDDTCPIFPKNTSSDYKAEKSSPLLGSYLHQLQSSTPEAEPK